MGNLRHYGQNERWGLDWSPEAKFPKRKQKPAGVPHSVPRHLFWENSVGRRSSKATAKSGLNYDSCDIPYSTWSWLSSLQKSKPVLQAGRLPEQTD